MNQIRDLFASAFTILLVLSIAGCGRIGTESPSDVVEAAYMAANAGNYSVAGSYLSSEVSEAMKSGLGALAGGMKGLWDSTTRNGTIDHIEILAEGIRGEGAEVKFRIHFLDGKIKDDEEPLIKENGKWMITIG